LSSAASSGEQHVADLKAAGLAQQARVVPGLLGLLDQPQIAVVLGVGRPLGRAGDVGLVPPDVGGQARADDDTRVGLVPSRRVVGAAFPAVEERDQPGRLVDPFAGQEPVPRQQPRVQVRRPALGELVLRPPSGHREDPVHRDRVHRRVADTAGRHLIGGVLAVPGAFPLRGPGPVAVRARVEDNMRHHAVAPLAGEERIKFQPGPRQVHRGKSDGVERGVPAPLVRIQAGGCLRDQAGAVVAQNIGRAGGQR